MSNPKLVAETLANMADCKALADMIGSALAGDAAALAQLEASACDPPVAEAALAMLQVFTCLRRCGHNTQQGSCPPCD